MSKFLQLCEEFDPQNEDLSLVALEVADKLTSKGIPTKNKGPYLLIECDGKNVIVEIKSSSPIQTGMEPEEEAENINAGFGTYDVEKAVQGLADTASSGVKGLAGKMFGTDASKAKSALKRRQKIAAKAINAYDQATNRLEKALTMQHNNQVNINY